MAKKIWFFCFAALAAAAIAYSVWMMAPAQNAPGGPRPAPGYWLRDKGGRVAVYAAGNSAEPVAVYDIYVNLLPQGDALQLKSGIPAADAAALERLLEDLGA